MARLIQQLHYENLANPYDNNFSPFGFLSNFLSNFFFLPFAVLMFGACEAIIYLHRYSIHTGTEYALDIPSIGLLRVIFGSHGNRISFGQSGRLFAFTFAVNVNQCGKKHAYSVPTGTEYGEKFCQRTFLQKVLSVGHFCQSYVSVGHFNKKNL